MRRRTAWAVPLACAVLLTGCAVGSQSADPSASPSVSGSAEPSTSAGPSASSSIAAADPEHAVDPPGRREGSLLPADLLVFSQESLDDAMVARIEKIDGVAGVEQLSMAQVSVENRMLDLVAVDPASYRNFNLAVTADSQEVWDRVAGGEVALDDDRRKLPTDDGFLTLGSGEEAPRVHVGAYAPQVEGLVDAVVNEKWGESMGMPTGNAVLVSTTITAPDRVVKPIQRIVGEDVSVQRLDVVAREGLDPEAAQTAVVVGAVPDAVGKFTYTVLGGGRIAPDPAWVDSHIVTEEVPILGSVTCNKVMMPQLRAALGEVVSRGLADKIHPDEYAGCYYPRFIAGSTSLSNHSFGIALDLNVPGNQRGTAGEIDRDVVAIFKKWGFAWGGDWNWTDPMHFEMNRVVQPGG